MQDWSTLYQPLAPESGSAGAWQVWRSELVQDPHWDRFLRSTPRGQYQQSSLWSEYKAIEGWQTHRVVVTQGAEIVGGFQLLWKKKSVARVGYVSKGPVVAREDAALELKLASLMAGAARTLGLQALIAQLPDEAALGSKSCRQAGFIASNPMEVIEATYLIEVSPGIEELRKKMHRNVRQCVRKARERGATVRAGTEADLPRFFELMVATCTRQNSSPNPATLPGLQRLWQIFSRDNAIEMSFAEANGRSIAGRINLLFGDRATQWKKGWDGTEPNCHPNELLVDHALEWAIAHGYRLCDFSAINLMNARRVEAGISSEGAIAKSRDMFNLRLGGYPKILPSPQLLIRNPLLRLGYRLTRLRKEQQREREMAVQLEAEKAAQAAKANAAAGT